MFLIETEGCAQNLAKPYRLKRGCIAVVHLYIRNQVARNGRWVTENPRRVPTPLIDPSPLI